MNTRTSSDYTVTVRYTLKIPFVAGFGGISTPQEVKVSLGKKF